MEPEDFRTLIEIQSLENQVAINRKNIATETNRIASIEKQRANAENELTQSNLQLEDLKKQISNDESELFKVDKNFEKTTSHASMVTSTAQADAIEHELQDLEQKKDQLEEVLLELFDQQETTENAIKESNVFLEGSLASLKEITAEVDEFTLKEENLIKGLEARVKSLVDIVPSSLNSLFKEANKNYRYKNPIAFLEKGYCNQCHYAADTLKEKGVDLMTSIETCEGCGRLLAPQASKSANLRA